MTDNALSTSHVQAETTSCSFQLKFSAYTSLQMKLYSLSFNSITRNVLRCPKIYWWRIRSVFQQHMWQMWMVFGIIRVENSNGTLSTWEHKHLCYLFISMPILVQFLAFFVAQRNITGRMAILYFTHKIQILNF